MTAPRTWDVTLRVTDHNPLDDCPPETWGFQVAFKAAWGEVEATFLSSTEVKVWRFGDIITDDNKPDVPFNAVAKDGEIRNEGHNLSAYGPWRLIWVDGQELV